MFLVLTYLIRHMWNATFKSHAAFFNLKRLKLVFDSVYVEIRRLNQALIDSVLNDSFVLIQ